MRCAALHRKLGTHISKVKSLSMDSWTNEQVEVSLVFCNYEEAVNDLQSMRQHGNAASNKLYNPQNVKPSIPFDVDEVDAAMERFIRQKYDKRTFSGSTIQQTTRNGTVSPRSSDEQPPPLPPKTERRFGFGLRSASSALPLSRRETESPPPSPDRSTRIAAIPAPIRVNKQSRIFGASVGVSEDGSEWKLVTLREMGFPDDKRNSNILKGLGGDLDRTVESLVRLGEGNQYTAKLKSPTHTWPTNSFPEPQISSNNQSQIESMAAPPTGSLSIGKQSTGGLSGNSQVQNQTTGVSDSVRPSQQQSYNPFDTGNLYSAPLQQPLENTFQNMHLSQPLFPNATGGHSSQQQHLQQSRLQQSMTPPVPQIPQQYHLTNPFAFQANHNYNPFISATQPTNFPIPTNPCQPPLQSPAPQNAYQSEAPLNPYQSSISSFSIPSPFAQHSIVDQPPPLPWGQVQSPQDTQSQYFPNQGQHAAVPSQNAPFSQYQGPQSVQPMQTIAQQQTGRFDKNSILALYNYPQLAPPPIPHQDNPNQSAVETTPTVRPSPAKPPPAMSFTLGQRSVTMPAALSAGSKNPFLTSRAPSTSATSFQASGDSRRVSQEESGGLGSGRHSPDAFANLSARYVR